MDMGREIVSKVADEIIKVLKESVGYMFCYKKKIEELESEIGKLKDQKTRIQGRVDRAKDCAELIEADVSNWITNVQNKEEEVGKFLEDKVKENKKCFKCWCPDLTWRHRLGKGAEEMKASVISLKDEGYKFETLPVSHPAPYPEELQLSSSGDYMDFNSRASVFNGIMGALKDSKVNLIVVHGPGGAGKTTMVKEAAKQAKKDGIFDEIVMAVVSKDANVRKIQEELAPKLNLTYTEDSEVGRKGQLWNRLQGGNKKILVIMDDVWQKLEMTEIGIPIADGGRGCKVLLTTRREGVCQKMQVHNQKTEVHNQKTEVYKDFPIGVLEKQEAWSLFKKAVGNVPTEVTQSEAEEVCKECGGLPVAIVAVGAALKGKEGHLWDDALNQLKNSSVQEIPDIDPKLYMSLKWSYDYLEQEDAKSCFLLCCLFPEDANIPIEDLVRYCTALRLLRHAETVEKARSRVQAMVTLLKSSCLLLDGEDENYVRMHDVIRDVAIIITSNKQEGQGQQWANKQQFLVKHGVQKWPEEDTSQHCTAVSIKANDMDRLPGDLKCPELHTLMLDCGNDDLRDVLPDPFFNGMDKLTVLRLEGALVQLPSSFTNLIDLRMLQTKTYFLRDLGRIKNLNKLEILTLHAVDMKELVPEIGELTGLRLLDLKECGSVEVIPQGVVSKLTRLEELYILEAFDGWEGSTTSNKEKSNVSFAELKSLKQLTILHVHIPDVNLLPNDLHFENLIKFQISVGGRFSLLEHRKSSSRKLRLEGFRLKANFNVLINRAEMLYLRNLEGLETLFHGTHDRRDSNLKWLEVIDCHDLKHLLLKPERLFSKLTEVVIENCSRLKYLCSSFCAKGLLQLQSLSITNCEIMEGIVEIEKEIDEEEPKNMIIDFIQLRKMRLVKLPKLISFYPETKRTIKKNSCAAEQSLFNEKAPFAVLALRNLKFLEVHECSSLRNLFTHSVASSLEQLVELSVESCELMEEVVTNKREEEAIEVNIEFPKLSLLKLGNLPNLESFCGANYTFNFPSLDLVILKQCPKMQTFTYGQAIMPKIGVITVGDEGQENFWIGDLNKYLKGEEIGTRINIAQEGHALYEKVYRESIAEGINKSEEIEEFLGRKIRRKIQSICSGY